MSWLKRFFNRFKRRDRVALADSLPGVLNIDSRFLLDAQKLPGVAFVPMAHEKVVSRGLSYFSTPGSQPEWVPPQYDHIEVEFLCDIESLFARATRAKLSLFLKEGFEFIGPNEKRVLYVKERIRQIERASSMPFDVLLYDTCRDLVVHSNAFWLKVRKDSASGGQKRRVGKRILNPVAGYFRLPPETMMPKIDTSGNIIKWKQSIGGIEKIFSTDDIVHFCTNRKAGYPLGVPSIIPAIDDIRALRSLEHNIDVLIHKHLFPIILWKVGTETRPAQIFDDGTKEIDIIQTKIANMPTEGSLVVPERYEVSAIGVENKALRVETYLQHFKERLYAGLDVSSIDVGIGNTSSRSTAQTLSRNLMDTVKLLQIIIQKLANPVLEELLLESTFDPGSVLERDNIVTLKFHEIDKESKQSEANHLMDLFTKNGISWPEFRMDIGREVLDPADEKDLYWHKFGKEIALTATDKNSSSSEAVANKNNPQNQSGSRGSAKLNKDEYAFSKEATNNPILSNHQLIASELQARWAAGNLKMSLAESDIKTAYSAALSEFEVIVNHQIRLNYPDPEGVHGLIKYLNKKIEDSMKRLEKDIIARLRRADSSPNVVFSALSYRTILIFDTELARAQNLARYRWLVKNQADIQIISNDNECEICTPKLTTINWNDKLGEADIPPFHPLCNCKVVMAKKV